MMISRKAALIVASALVAIGLAGVVTWARLIDGKLPTLPTPAGVTVPLGMRYVGGDEFNSSGDGKPDSTKWLVVANAEPTAGEARVANGVLTLSPAGKSSANSASVTYRQALDGRRRLRIELRFRMPCVPSALRRMNADNRPNSGWNLANCSFSPAAPEACYVIGFASVGYSNSDTPGDGKKRLNEEAGVTSLSNASTGGHYDGEFHDYAIEWCGESVRVFRDGAEVPDALKNAMLRSSVIGYEWRRRLKFLPDVLRNPLFEWNRWNFDRPHHLSLGCADVPPIPEDDRLRIEVDHLRVFQAD